MARELSPFELDRELARVAGRVKAAYRALRTGREVTLSVPEVLRDPETLERLAGERSDPIAAPLVRWLYWLELMHRALPREGERVRRYRTERHALDAPLHGEFSLRELLGNALRDRARRAALLERLFERGDGLRDAVTQLYEVRAELPKFGGKSRSELELPCAEAELTQVARQLLTSSADAYGSLGVRDLDGLIEAGLANAAADGWPRQLSLRSLNDLLGSPTMLQSLRLELSDRELPAALAPASFARGMLRLGAAFHDALAPTNQPYSVAFDPFGLARATAGARVAALLIEPAFAKRQFGLGRERAVQHVRAMAASALVFARCLALRVLQADAALQGPRALRDALSELAPVALGFELPPSARGVLLRPRLGDAQRFAGVLLAATQAQALADEHDEDWYRNPRAVEQLRAEARMPPETRASAEQLEGGAQLLARKLAALL